MIKSVKSCITIGTALALIASTAYRAAYLNNPDIRLIADNIITLADVANNLTKVSIKDCEREILRTKSEALVCIPKNNYRNKLIVFLGGTTNYDTSLENDINLLNPSLTVGGIKLTLAEFLMSRGYAIAFNIGNGGLRLEKGIDNFNEINDIIYLKTGRHPGYRLVMGGSQGGYDVAWIVENMPQAASAGLALCAPLGGYSNTLQVIADYHVVFNALFGDKLLGPIENPSIPAKYWENILREKILRVMEKNPDLTLKLANILHMPNASRDNLGIIRLNISEVLAYSMQIRSQTIELLGGNPVTNRQKIYGGGIDKLVERFDADKDAADILLRYSLNGKPKIPFYSVWTKNDPLMAGDREAYEKLLDPAYASYYHGDTADGDIHCSFNLDKLYQLIMQIEIEVTGSTSLPVGLTNVLKNKRNW